MLKVVDRKQSGHVCLDPKSGVTIFNSICMIVQKSSFDR